MTYADAVIRWRVPDLLKKHNISAYSLASKLAGKVNRNSVYAIAKGEPERVDRNTLNHLVIVLRELTGNQTLNVGDLLEFTENGEQPELVQ
jgi:hypothetical protein